MVNQTGKSQMRRSLTLSMLLAGLAQPVVANDSTFEWTQDRFDFVAAGDSQAGGDLVKKLRCAKCHGDTGISDDEEVPSIAGQRATYLFKQLTDFRHGGRDDEDMVKVSKKLSEQQMADVSAWYHMQERPPMRGGQPLLVVKICDSCHEKEVVEKDNRIEVAPILGGQVRQYLEKTMMQFKASDRTNDLFLRMQSVSHKLTDSEIKALATYYGAPDPAN